MILLDIFGQSPIQGPGTATFAEHLVEIVAMLLAAFLLGLWLGRIAVNKWRNKHKELDAELAMQKAEILGIEDKKLEIMTLNDKIKLLEDKNSRLRLEASQPVVKSADVLLEAKLKTQEQLISKLNADIANLKAGQANFSKTIDVAKVVENKPKPVVAKAKVVTKAKPKVIAESKPAKTTKAVKSPPKKAAKKGSTGGDDLKKIEGVGPKIEQLLNADGVKSYDDVMVIGADKIREILLKAGPQYKVHDPSTWGDQSQLAKDEKWDELYEMQTQLKGGKKV
jgi:predicted flap endonuclease-1-like 5' DNA nuclease